MARILKPNFNLTFFPLHSSLKMVKFYCVFTNSTLSVCIFHHLLDFTSYSAFCKRKNHFSFELLTPEECRWGSSCKFCTLCIFNLTPRVHCTIIIILLITQPLAAPDSGHDITSSLAHSSRAIFQFEREPLNVRDDDDFTRRSVARLPSFGSVMWSLHVCHMFLCASVFCFFFRLSSICAITKQCAHPQESAPNWFLFPVVSSEILFFAKQSYRMTFPTVVFIELWSRWSYFAKWCHLVVFFFLRGGIASYLVFALEVCWRTVKDDDCFHCLGDGFSFCVFVIDFKKRMKWVVANFKVVAIEAALTMWSKALPFSSQFHHILFG